MLAQNFKTAADLSISEIELGALIKTLGYLERGDLPGTLDLRLWAVEGETECGTLACIAGWAWIFSGKRAFIDIVGSEGLGNGEDWTESRPQALKDLFLSLARPKEDAPAALRNYLTTGAPAWPDRSRDND